MDLLKLARKERVKLELQLTKLQGQIRRLRTAETALSPHVYSVFANAIAKTGPSLVKPHKKRVLTPAGRKAIRAALKRRWAKYHRKAA